MKIRFVYTALQVRDLDRSERFYTKTLGMTSVVRKTVKETSGEMCVLKSGRSRLELNRYEGATVRKGIRSITSRLRSTFPSLSGVRQGT